MGSNRGRPLRFETSGGLARVRTTVSPLDRQVRKPWAGKEVAHVNKRQTGSKAASAAGKVLANPKSNASAKKAAASALSQTPKKGR